MPSGHLVVLKQCVPVAKMSRLKSLARVSKLAFVNHCRTTLELRPWISMSCNHESFDFFVKVIWLYTSILHICIYYIYTYTHIHWLFPYVSWLQNLHRRPLGCKDHGHEEWLCRHCKVSGRCNVRRSSWFPWQLTWRFHLVRLARNQMNQKEWGSDWIDSGWAVTFCVFLWQVVWDTDA